MLIINKIRSFTKLQLSVKLKISFRKMETESLRTSNAVVDYNVRKESVYMEESENIVKYIFNGIKENINFSEIATDSVPTLGYIIDPRSFAYSIEYLREQVSKQGLEQAEMFNNLIQQMDDLGLYNITGDNVVLNKNYKDIYNDYVTNISYNTLETKDISNSDTTSNTASDSNSDVVKASDTESESESERYSLPADSDSTSNSSNSGISFEHDLNLEDNKTILILTVITFVAIKFIAWYVHTYHKDTTAISQSDVNNTDDSLHSVYEHSFNYLSYKLFLCLVPSFFVILYSLRYYYFYKLRDYFYINVNK